MKKRWIAGLLAGVMSAGILTGCVPPQLQEEAKVAPLSPAEVRVDVSHAVKNSLPSAMSGMEMFLWNSDGFYEDVVQKTADLMEWCDRYLVEGVAGSSSQEVERAVRLYADQLDEEDWSKVQKNWLKVNEMSAQLLNGSPEALQVLEAAGRQLPDRDTVPARWKVFQQVCMRIFGWEEMTVTLKHALDELIGWQQSTQADEARTAMALLRWSVENDAASVSEELLQNEMLSWAKNCGAHDAERINANWRGAVLAGDRLLEQDPDILKLVSEEDAGLLEQEGTAASWNAMKNGFMATQAFCDMWMILSFMGSGTAGSYQDSVDAWSQMILRYCASAGTGKLDPKQLENGAWHWYTTSLTEAQQETLVKRWMDIEPHIAGQTAGKPENKDWLPVLAALQKVLGKNSFLKPLKESLTQMKDWIASSILPAAQNRETAQLILLCEAHKITEMDESAVHHALNSWFEENDELGKNEIRMGWRDMREIGSRLTAEQSPERDALDLTSEQKQTLAGAAYTWDVMKKMADDVFMFKMSDGNLLPGDQMESMAKLRRALRLLMTDKDIIKSAQDWLPLTAAFYSVALDYNGMPKTDWVREALEDWYNKEVTGSMRWIVRKNWSVVQISWRRISISQASQTDINKLMKDMNIQPMPKMSLRQWDRFAREVERVIIESQLQEDTENFVFEITKWWIGQEDAKTQATAVAYEMLEWTLLDNEASITYQDGVLDKIWKDYFNTLGPGKRKALIDNIGLVRECGDKLLAQDYETWMDSPNPAGYGTKRYREEKWKALRDALS